MEQRMVNIQLKSSRKKLLNIETRKGFKAPRGAIVDIKSGEIW